MENIKSIQEELNRARSELNVLYEISNAMRTTLQLDEILYIILTGVTAHVGLGFNRAILFLVNEQEKIVEGKMAIGPDTGEEANRIWTKIEEEKKNLDDLIGAYEASDRMIESSLNRQITHIKIPLEANSNNLLAIGVLDAMPLHLTKETIVNYKNDPLVRMLDTEEIAIVPLRGKDKVNGIITADNIFTKKPITKDDLRLLMMLANQAGLAIENSRLYENAIIRSHTDSLTNLWNHGYFQYTLQKELEKAGALNSAVSLIMIDMDNFKDYNDTWGHQTGDKILRDLAGLIQSYSRKMDYVCRYGGEEFTVILPQANKADAIRLAERLREAIIRHKFSHEEIMPGKELTASFGIATYPQDGKTPHELISHSDKMLLKAKKEGKNRVY
ncbi:MAG: diguanylate cyclase [Candidatus Omnitrophica bacterium]|nr:diguanylate cyclase [Candidatus Omnitrophota bacterium]